MTKTLLTRISILSQYNSENKTILWEDPASNRWDNIYGQLVENDNAIFISNDKLLIGIISEVNYGKSLFCINIEEINCQNDQFLRLHTAYPELISRVKANFQPFIHPLQLDLNQLIADAKNQNFINFYILSSEEKYNELSPSFKENDRIVLLDINHHFQNVKINYKENLIDFPKELEINISIEGLAIDEVLHKNKNYKRKSLKSNNVSRIEKIKKEITNNEIFKFTSFFTYHDTLFNKRVYQKKEEKSKINTIYLNPDESIFKVSMSGKDIDDKAFNFFNDNNLLIVHSQTKAKGVSTQTQGDTFRKQMKIGDYFYMCRGNNNLEVIGKITDDAKFCEYEDFGDDGWLQRSYEIVSEAIKEESYNDDKKWWTPNDNSTCIIIPSKEIKEANNKLFIPYFDTQFELKNNSFTTSFNSNKIMSKNLNQILYGPPGTGKTYKLQNEFFEKFTLKESSVSKDQFLENLVSELSWWQVITIAVFDLKTAKVNDIYNHKIIKVKEKLSDSNTIRHTIWGQLQRHTILDCPNVNARERSEPLYFSKDENSNWTINHELLDQYYPEALDILKSIQNFTGNEGIVVKNYDFVTFHQSFSYEDFIEGIKPKLEDGETELGFEIKDGVFKKLCLKAEADPNSNYAIFIDEINRGNVSAIFGELITLIEEDKRLSAKNELKIKLPYSKREFGVPSNLYIIGTMNTADRSVEALDTALRRRFCFVEMMPDLKVVADKNFTDYNRVQIMEKINQRVELLLDRNYTLGHSYFIKDHFKSSFENEIIPLLQEYFYNDCGKIGLVLGKGFVREKEVSKNNSISIFADFDTKNEVDIIKSYELIPFNEIDFKIAIETLLA